MIRALFSGGLIGLAKEIARLVCALGVALLIAALFSALSPANAADTAQTPRIIGTGWIIGVCAALVVVFGIWLGHWVAYGDDSREED